MQTKEVGNFYETGRDTSVSGTTYVYLREGRAPDNHVILRKVTASNVSVISYFEGTTGADTNWGNRTTLTYAATPEKDPLLWVTFF